MEEEKNQTKKGISVWLLIVLLIAAAIGGLLLGKILFDKTNSKELKTEENEKSKEETKTEENEKSKEETKTEAKNETKVEEIRETYSFNGENNNRHISIKVNIINDNEMTVFSGDGMAEIEGTKGVYFIKDDVLTYTRIYYDYHIGGNGYNYKYWVPCITIDDQRDEMIEKVDKGITCGGVSRTQKFIIDKMNNTLILNTKQNYDTDYAKFDEYAKYDNIVLQLQ